MSDKTTEDDRGDKPALVDQEDRGQDDRAPGIARAMDELRTRTPFPAAERGRPNSTRTHRRGTRITSAVV
jgi:hypothetical protein